MPGKPQHAKSATAIARTGDVLAASRNRAVLDIIRAGRKSSLPAARAATIRAAIRRLDAPTHTQLIREFGALAEADRTVLCEMHSAIPHHAAPALKSAVLEGDATLCKNACQIIAQSCDTDLFSILVKAAEDKKHRHRSDVTRAIFELSSRVSRELAQWAAGERSGHDPSFKRHQLLNALEHSISRFADHHRREILDAFLLLAPVDNATLLKIFHDPSHPCHAAVKTELTSSQDSGIMERLVELMRDTDAPSAALEVVAARADHRFVETLLCGLKRPLPVRVLHNMKRLGHVAWLKESRDVLLELDGRAQATAVELAMASDMNRDGTFELLAFFMENGLAEARRASCQSLAKFEGHKADDIVWAALDDPDAGVQAAAVRQLRTRRMPDALQRLVVLLDSRLPEVRDAARSSLAEFNFTRYRTMFDLLDEQSARTTGVLVHKVDHSSQQKLIEELASPSISTKLRGIEMALAMGAADDVRQQLIELVGHESVTVRKEAVVALAHCRGERVVATLTVAAADHNRSIAEAARGSLSQLRLSEATSAGHVSVAGGTA